MRAAFRRWLNFPSSSQRPNASSTKKTRTKTCACCFAPGSSLGGARPKASVRLKDGSLAIAKFPRRDDEINVVAWEAVAFTLAGKAGIVTPRVRLEEVAGQPVLVATRFDRVKGRRKP